MTTIAWDGEFLVADGLAVNGNEMIVSSKVKKIRPLKNGGYIAFAGSWTVGEAFERWFNGEIEAPEGVEGFAVIYIDPDKKHWLYDNTTKAAIPLEKRGAIGSGGTYATAILDYGGSAIDAVKIASKRDVSTGGKIISVRYNIVNTPSNP